LLHLADPVVLSPTQVWPTRHAAAQNHQAKPIAVEILLRDAD